MSSPGRRPGSKKELALLLERVGPPLKPKPHLEQHTTPSDIAAMILWEAYMRGDVEDLVVADLGCGTGRIAIGASLMGAGHVIGVDVDLEVLAQALGNVKAMGVPNVDLLQAYIPVLEVRCDTVIMNPPFGVHRRHADRVFLECALRLAQVVYSIHLYNPRSDVLLRDIAERHGFKAYTLWVGYYPITQEFPYHYKRVYRILVGVYRFERP